MRKRVLSKGKGPDQPSQPRTDQSLDCPLTESFDTIKCINRQQIHLWDVVHVQADLNPHSLRMFDGTLSHDVAQYFIK